MPTPVIASTEQSTKPGIDGKDTYEIKFYWQDNGAQDNFYLVGVKNANVAYPEYGALSDEFFQGNSMFALYRDDKLKKGDVIQFSIQGITEQYSNYMNKLLSIAGSDSGSPFATPPATVRGNIINQTNPNDYPLGFFPPIRNRFRHLYYSVANPAHEAVSRTGEAIHYKSSFKKLFF